MSIQIEQLTYEHADREILFQNISFNIQDGAKATLIGNNGAGKSTLLKVIANQLSPHSGNVRISSSPYFVPQHFGQYDDMTIYEALDVDYKVDALKHILEGNDNIDYQEYLEALDDDWEIEERVKKALSTWQLDNIDPTSKLNLLSGGEKTKIFLAGIELHNPAIILMDEPSNHLDYRSRDMLCNLITSTPATVIVVSHDKTVLNLVTQTYELTKLGIKFYAGNYDFYEEQKEAETTLAIAQLEEKNKELRQAKKVQQEVVERRQKLDARGYDRSNKKGLGKMLMHIRKDKAEKTTSKLHDSHIGKIDDIVEDISEIENNMDKSKQMKVNFNSSKLHKGKILAEAKELNHRYLEKSLWQSPLNFKVQSGERILIRGLNGAGKSTLIKLLTKKFQPSQGELYVADFDYVHLDQEYSMIDNSTTVYEQAKKYAPEMLEHEVKMNLSRFLFDHSTWNKQCSLLSGGEKMKLSLCCLLLDSSQPDMIILDEPTNNIDLKNIKILISCIRDYLGTILLVSHDTFFIEQVKVDYEIELN